VICAFTRRATQKPLDCGFESAAFAPKNSVRRSFHWKSAAWAVHQRISDCRWSRRQGTFSLPPAVIVNSQLFLNFQIHR